MRAQRFTARIGPGVSIAEDVTYCELVDRILEFVVRAAIARATDRSSWEEEELRRQGLKRIEFARDGKALWWDPDAFAAEKAEADREGATELFLSRNECGVRFFETLDLDLRARLRSAGYSTASLLAEMNEIYREIAGDASDRSMKANEALIDEIMSP